MLLDCTLRDGGFVNDWEFGYSSIRSIVSRLDRAGVEIIEVGWIDARRDYDPNRSTFPDTASIDTTLKGLVIDQAALVAMIDFGTCPIENIAPAEESLLEGIRVIFKKGDVDAALAFCAEIRSKGYKIFVNPVSLTTYSDREILDLVEKINALQPTAMAIVDTYGLMLRDEILHYVDLLDRNLDGAIMLGYHSHNNQQMAFANCCALLDRHIKRGLIVDASLYGMGKSAGNANTELIAAYVNRALDGKYHTEQLLDVIQTDILRIHRDHPWGYNLHYYISAVNDCHPDYVKFLLDKGTLSSQGIDTVLKSIPVKQKLSFSRELIVELYLGYQSVLVDDREAIASISRELADREVLVLFPGATIKSHHLSIQDFLAAKSPVVITVNFASDEISADYVFVGNGQRYDNLLDFFHIHPVSPRVIATSNILESSVPIDFVLNYESLLEPTHPVDDNSAVLCLNLLRKAGVKQVHFAGLDGFSSDRAKDFFDPTMDMSPTAENTSTHNAGMVAYLESARQDIAIQFLTPSLFNFEKGPSKTS